MFVLLLAPPTHEWDVFDALTSDRVYRPRFQLVQAIEMMKKETGKHFDPELLSIFWDRLSEVLAVQDEYRSEPAQTTPRRYRAR